MVIVLFNATLHRGGDTDVSIYESFPMFLKSVTMNLAIERIFPYRDETETHKIRSRDPLHHCWIIIKCINKLGHKKMVCLRNLRALL